MNLYLKNIQKSILFICMLLFASVVYAQQRAQSETLGDCVKILIFAS